MYFFVSITQCECVCVCLRTHPRVWHPVCMLMSNKLMETVDREPRDRRPFCYSDVVGFVLLLANRTHDFHTFICCLCILPDRPGTAANNVLSHHISLPLH